MNRALIVLSGGQDSTTCLALAMRELGVSNVYALTIDYGQRHRAEIASACRIAELAGLGDRHEVLSVSSILAGTSPLINTRTNVEHYTSAAVLPGGLEATFVPMRNMLFLTLAANRACVIGDPSGRTDIYTGLSQEDYGGYPDCRQPFLDSAGSAIRAALDDSSITFISLRAPLMHLTKKQTVELSERMPGARELLAYSHTCYEGEVPPCGECHACLLRAKGYEEAGVIDPLLERLGRDNP